MFLSKGKETYLSGRELVQHIISLLNLSPSFPKSRLSSFPAHSSIPRPHRSSHPILSSMSDFYLINDLESQKKYLKSHEAQRYREDVYFIHYLDIGRKNILQV